MALVLKSWVGKDYLNKQLIPADTVPQKLVKDLTKQVAYVDKTALAENPVAPPQRPQVRSRMGCCWQVLEESWYMSVCERVWLSSQGFHGQTFGWSHLDVCPWFKSILILIIQRKNAGANMVVGRKGAKKEKEVPPPESEVPKKAKKGKKAAEPEKEKPVDPIRSPLFNISKPIPSSPTAGQMR